MSRGRGASAVLVAVGLALVATPVAVRAQNEPSLGSFTVSSESSGVAMLFGDPGSQPYPVAAGYVPETLATLGGAGGYAFSSAGWPGPLVGNAGSLAGLLLPACSQPGLPVPQACFPPDPSSTATVKNLALYANYPVRAEASAPGGKSEDTLGPLRARASQEATEAEATVADFSSSGILTSGTVSTRSRSFRQGGRVVAVAESVLAGLNLAGGTVTADLVRTVATAASDGRDATTSFDVVVKGLQVAGRKATIDRNGIRFEGQGSSTDPVVQQVNQQLLRNFGIQLFLTQPVVNRVERGDRASARVHTGALVVIWTLGSGPNHVIVSLGGSAAQAEAAPGFSFSFPPEPPGPGPDGGPVPPDGGGFPTVLGAALGGNGLSAGGGGPAGVSGPEQLALGEVQPEPVRASRYFEGVSGWQIFLVVLGTLVAGLGLRRLRAGAVPVAAVGGGCPLERRRT